MSGPFTISVLGAGGAGKSTFSIRIMTGRFVDEYDPTVEDMLRGNVIIDGEQVALKIFDSAHLEFDGWPWRRIHLERSDAFIIIFSTTSHRTFEETSEFKAQIERAVPFNSRPVMLIGTKNDLDDARDVPLDEAYRLAEEWGVQYFDVSSYSEDNLKPAMSALLKEIRVSCERLALLPPPKTNKPCTIQ